MKNKDLARPPARVGDEQATAGNNGTHPTCHLCGHPTSSEEAARERFPMLLLAEAVASSAHIGSVDKAGEPYIRHPARVAAAVQDYVGKMAAWLHDVAEDEPAYWAQTSHLFDEMVREIVAIVTKHPRETYEGFIERIAASRNGLAIAVKLADLRDNLRPGGPAPLRRRYEAAIAVLEAAVTPVDRCGHPARIHNPPRRPGDRQMA